MKTPKPLPDQAGRQRIFIVDDHPVFAEGLLGLLKREKDLTVCGLAANAPEALAAIRELKPDLVLADIGLPGRSGLELVKDILAVRKEAAVLVISMHDETLYAERVLRAGARGYIMKQEGPDKIVRAIRQVLSGEVSLSAKMSARLLAVLAGQPNPRKSPISGLSDREFEIFQLIGRGRDSHAIAAQLDLSVKTVDAHRGHLKEKLELGSGTELICYAARWVESAPTAS